MSSRSNLCGGAWLLVLVSMGAARAEGRSVGEPLIVANVALRLPSGVCDAGWFPRLCLLMRFRTDEAADAAIAEA